MTRVNAELAEHAEKFLEFFSAGFAVSALNVISSRNTEHYGTDVGVAGLGASVLMSL
jgi:hypothetical protein